MAENNIRKCPNTTCGMPVFKFDGCNKVQCTRCTKCMCFKCPPDQMIAYETPNDAYEHLNKVHGGYWWCNRLEIYDNKWIISIVIIS
jgi:hypothetical protein